MSLSLTGVRAATVIGGSLTAATIELYQQGGVLLGGRMTNELRYTK